MAAIYTGWWVAVAFWVVEGVEGGGSERECGEVVGGIWTTMTTYPTKKNC